ncbi:MAG TPA: type 1 glutamine amidotransferase [Spirochaetota bacterium]|nr:type 1 glutamine amidotransferase [Spirochaetota bacterium]
MKIHYLQHVDFETPANILDWASSHNHSVTKTFLHNNENFPDINDFDVLIVMGGPMGVYDDKEYPYLKEEKSFIEKVIKQNKRVLGICLGAQLIADVLGAKVYTNRYKEIGFFPIKLFKENFKISLFKDFPDELNCFHWHGDTFDIPDNAVKIANSNGCENQGFIYNDKVIGLQFHIEVNEIGIRQLIDNCKHELKKDVYIQNEEEIIKNFINLPKLKKLLFNFMDKFITL